MWLALKRLALGIVLIIIASAILLGSDWAAFASIARSAQTARVPVFGFLSSDLGNGAAVVLARDYFDGGREAALMAVRIMRGERPAAIPFRPLEATQLLVNLEAARAVGLTIPPAVLGRASKVIGG